MALDKDDSLSFSARSEGRCSYCCRYLARVVRSTLTLGHWLNGRRPVTVGWRGGGAPKLGGFLAGQGE